MTRRIVYGIGLWVFLAATAMTLTSIALPQWLTYSSPTDYSPNPNRPSAPIKISYGLHKRCSSLSGTCSDFPTFEDCHGSDERYFCSMWRTVGFLMSFSVVIEFATVVAFAVVLVGGRQYREIGWKMCVGMLSVVAASQCAGMAIVAFLNDHDSKFAIGYKLDTSWILCTVSWITLALDAAGLAVSAKVMQPEDDYEPIPDR